MMQKNNDLQQEQPAHKRVITIQDLGLENIEQVSVSATCFAEYIRALRQNWRQGTVGCKDRSEVAFSNRKPWKQKGTGRARAGTRRSPLWRKGGVIFGPQSRTRTLGITHKMRRGVLRSLLFNALGSGRVVSIAYDGQGHLKTNQALKLLRDAGLVGKKVILFTSIHDVHVHAAFTNISTVQLALFDQQNAFSLANAAYWVYFQKDRDTFQHMVQQWI